MTTQDPEVQRLETYCKFSWVTVYLVKISLCIAALQTFVFAIQLGSFSKYTVTVAQTDYYKCLGTELPAIGWGIGMIITNIVYLCVYL